MKHQSTTCRQRFTGVFGAALLSAQSAGAATYTVTNLNDSGPGSLRQALVSANANTSATAASPHIIDATGVTGTIMVTGGQLRLDNHLTVEGPPLSASGPQLILDSTGNGDWQTLANDESNSTVRNRVQIIRRLIIQNGRSHNGGGVLNSNKMTLDHCVIRGCRTYGVGGGIRNNNYGEVR